MIVPVAAASDGAAVTAALTSGTFRRKYARRCALAACQSTGAVDPKRRYMVAHAVWKATSLQIKLAGGRRVVSALSARLTGVAGGSGRLKATHDSSAPSSTTVTIRSSLASR